MAKPWIGWKRSATNNIANETLRFRQNRTWIPRCRSVRARYQFSVPLRQVMRILLLAIAGQR